MIKKDNSISKSWLIGRHGITYIESTISFATRMSHSWRGFEQVGGERSTQQNAYYYKEKILGTGERATGLDAEYHSNCGKGW